MSRFTNTLYICISILLAYAPYKPNQKKLFIGTSLAYAIFVSIWFSVFICALVSPALPYMQVVHDWDWMFPVVTLIWFIAPIVVRRFGREPQVSIADKPARLLIRFEQKMFLTKYFEILFQQSMFVYILFVLLRGLSYGNAILWFIAIIGIIHLGNFPFTGKKDTLFYFYLSLPMAALFGILIMHGYVAITVAIHMLFYLVFNGRHWFIKNTTI